MPKALVSFFSENTNKFYRLVETRDLPFLEISGIRMHCTGESVRKSTHAMVSQLFPLKGKVLDTCAGLGYTAIEIASHAEVEKVFSFEIDSNVLEIARQNQFSKELFENKKIFLENADVFLAVKKFPENFFDRILHDPPRFALAGELYGRPFYKELFRVLKYGGILFHYTGNPGQKSGRDFKGGVIKRLQEAGFSGMERIPEAQGIRAKKFEFFAEKRE
ncbi:MAG TPA: RsmD family RNA methyltransferase [archaeon]|nr:RsmD family RNA methyltransferase [archaeon]